MTNIDRILTAIGPRLRSLRLQCGLTLPALVGAPETGDPRVHLLPVTLGGMTDVPLSRRPGGLHAHKLVISPAAGA